MFTPKVTLQGEGSTYFLAIGKREMFDFHGGKPVAVPVRVAAEIWDEPRFKIEGLEKVESPVQNVKVKTFQMRFDLCL